MNEVNKSASKQSVIKEGSYCVLQVAETTQHYSMHTLHSPHTTRYSYTWSTGHWLKISLKLSSVFTTSHFLVDCYVINTQLNI